MEKKLAKSGGSFCALPWLHLNINPNGKINPCCSTTETFSLGDVKLTPLKEAWNSEGLREIRRLMLQGQVPDACEGCFALEGHGGESDRNRANNYFPLKIQDAERLTKTDGTIKTFKLKSLDVRFSNFCNLSCRICRPSASTSWYTDAKLLGYKHIELNKKITPTPGNVLLLQQIGPLLGELDRIFFVGGEPLLQKEHYTVLDQLRAEGRQDIFLDYVSNFTELKFGKYQVLDYWAYFKKVSVSISLDAAEKRGELLRKGLSWKKFLENLELVRSKAPHVHLVVSPTISLHNIFHIPEFVRILLFDLGFPPEDISLKILTHPDYYSIEGLTPELKRDVCAALALFTKELSESLGEAKANIIIKQIKAVEAFMLSRDASDKFKYFVSMNKRLDFLRGENFGSIFPEYEQFNDVH